MSVCVCVYVNICLGVRERQGVVSLPCCVCACVRVWMLIGMPCMELGVCQEYSMRAVMGECVECISEPVANQVSLIGHGCSQRSCECNCSVCVCVQ